MPDKYPNVKKWMEKYHYTSDRIIHVIEDLKQPVWSGYTLDGMRDFGCAHMAEFLRAMHEDQPDVIQYWSDCRRAWGSWELGGLLPGHLRCRVDPEFKFDPVDLEEDKLLILKWDPVTRSYNGDGFCCTGVHWVSHYLDRHGYDFLGFFTDQRNIVGEVAGSSSILYYDETDKRWCRNPYAVGRKRKVSRKE